MEGVVDWGERRKVHVWQRKPMGLTECGRAALACLPGGRTLDNQKRQVDKELVDEMEPEPYLDG